MIVFASWVLLYNTTCTFSLLTPIYWADTLAGLYESQGKYEAAEPLYLQAIEIFKQSLGEEHPNTQTVLINYQIFLNDKNESKQNQDKY